MSSSAASLPSITLKKVPNAGLGDLSHCKFEKVKVMNTGDRGMCSDVIWRGAGHRMRGWILMVDVKGEVGPRVLRFLETPVVVIDLETQDGEVGRSPGGGRGKRKREG